MVSYKLLVSILASLYLSKARVIESELPVSQDGRCGKGIAVCREGFCCSKLGWCGNSEYHCKIEEGCQSEFGICDNTPIDVSVPTDDIDDEEPTEFVSDIPDEKDVDIIEGKCGVGYGSCGEGYCCSRFGWCGKTDEYCNISKGCQFEFGICNSDGSIVDDNDSDDEELPVPKDEDNEKSEDEGLPVSKDGRCGEGIAICKEGYCCSKGGWCGKSDDHCSFNRGCQVAYGLCILNEPDDVEENVQPDDVKEKEVPEIHGDGKEPIPFDDDNESDDEELPISKDGKCGKGIAVCGEGLCCSAHGWCGASKEYCSVEEGCQSEFGTCNAPEEENSDDEEVIKTTITITTTKSVIPDEQPTGIQEDIPDEPEVTDAPADHETIVIVKTINTGEVFTEAAN
jgi:hypothetical protein